MDPKKATASNETVKEQLAKETRENQELKTERDALKTENTALKRQLTEANTVIERDLKSELVLRIKGRSNFNDADLEPKNIEQLQTIDATLSMGKTDARDIGKAPYTSIRTGTDTDKSNLSVGSLFGKTRKEVLEMGAD